MEISFKNKTVLITGSSSGIGRATAVLFAESGADIIINYNQSQQEAMVTKQMVNELGRKAYLEQADVSERKSVEDMFSRIKQYTDKVDILVNNAGIINKNYFSYMTEVQWDEVINTNLKGSFLCTKLALKMMMVKRAGVIINVSSSVVFKANICQSAYQISKAGLNAMTKSVAKEVGKMGIRVNAVAPGPVYTKMNKMTPQNEKEAIDLIPLKRIAKSEDIAAAIVFLCSEYASYITGQVLIADGGLTL